MITHVIVGSLQSLINILVWLILLRVIFSWIRPNPGGSGGEFVMRLHSVVFQLTEPLIAPIRGLMPGAGMGLDLSPLILLLILRFLQRFIAGLI